MRADLALLNEINNLAHGEFGSWLKDNCRVSQNHANKYMKLVKENPEYLNYSCTSNFSIEAAYALLSAPDGQRQPLLKTV